MAVALFAVLLLITAASAYLMISHPWWFPAGASMVAGSVDHQFGQAMRMLGALFIAAQVLLAFSCFYPGGGKRAKISSRQ